MANLTSESIDEVWQLIMSDFSSVRTLIPISKTQLRQLLVLMDEEIETAETSIISAIPPSDGKTWLVENQSLGRGIMLSVLRKRKEVL